MIQTPGNAFPSQRKHRMNNTTNSNQQLTSAASVNNPSKVVLISGASSGIGEASARFLAARGHRVVLGARRLDRIAALAEEIRAAGGQALALALDVTELASFQAFAAAARECHGRIDVLVNNAGVMPLSLMQDLRVADWNQMIDVNLRGVLHGIASVLPIMQAQGCGQVVNIASVSAHRVDATAAVYCATKHAVRALSEGLRQETQHLRVTLISPGLTRSELADGIADPQVKAGVRAMMAQASIAPEAIAQAIQYAITQPNEVDVNELIVRPTAQQ
jgi:NADP-dependent 3-hydroxy acid dehydrogenase YdfG